MSTEQPDHIEPFARERLAGYSPAIVDTPLLVLGAGAGGSTLACLLAQWGFHDAVVVDFDHYEPSNATRVYEFPFGAVAKGRHVPKASHLCRAWRRRLRRSGVAGTRVSAIVGYAQEVPPAVWRRVCAVLACVDHPRARFDVARLARHYGKPLLMAAFDAEVATACVEYFPAERDAACIACALATEPTYAASEAGCGATALRIIEARKLPATPNLSTASAALMAQALVDGLNQGFPSAASVQRIALSARAAGTSGDFSIGRDPDCPHHEELPRVQAKLRGRTLGAVLRTLEKRLPGCRLELPGLFPVYVPASDGSNLVVAALPPWRCSPAAIGGFAPAPAHASPLALDSIDATLADRFGVARLPARWFGVGRGAVVTVVTESRERMAVEDDGSLGLGQ